MRPETRTSLLATISSRPCFGLTILVFSRSAGFKVTLGVQASPVVIASDAIAFISNVIRWLWPGASTPVMAIGDVILQGSSISGRRYLQNSAISETRTLELFVMIALASDSLVSSTTLEAITLLCW